MIIGILKEGGNENRISFLPAEIAIVEKLGIEVLIEKGAGIKSYTKDQEYTDVGANVISRQEVILGADLLISINPPVNDDLKTFKEEQVLISDLRPTENSEWIERARIKGLTLLGLDLIPRVTRAQSMDILSSMATVSGYKAVLEAAMQLPRFFPMFMSAAGTIKPARVLILGAGVAGLQAIAISRKLGAVVEVFDVR